MKKATKILALLMCAVLLVVASVAGTLAYLTSQDKVVNTFTVGNVQMYLDEKDVDNSKTHVEPGVTGRDKVNDYHLMPGCEYEKDPTVTVLANSDECYVRMIMTINKQDELDAIFETINGIREKANQAPISIADVLTGYSSTWNLVKETENADNTRTYEFRYFEAVTAGTANKTLEPLFTRLVMPAEMTNEQMATLYVQGEDDNLKIDVVAHAIQTADFADVDAAWAAFDIQNG